MDYNTVISFWFDQIEPKSWWKADPAFDRIIAGRFIDFYRAATQGELSGWRRSAHGRLAEIIVLDQFSRNIYRGDRRAFESDSMALVLSQEAISAAADRDLTNDQKSFMYMPFMHSESPVIHQQAVRLFTDAGLKFNLEFELKHKAIIDQFGRYPHRNMVLGRPSTDEETEFLKHPGQSF